MARGRRLANSYVRDDPWTSLKAFTSMVFLSAVFASAVPISENPSYTALSTLEQRAVKWSFNCYSASQACRGMGNTSGAGSSTQKCQPIDGRGCSRYSYNGGGKFKLVGYLGPSCTDEDIVSVNGGSVTCLEAPENWSSYEIVNTT